MNIKREMTDVELCANLVPRAVDNYRRALDVMFAYPDYAKSQFRIVVEHLTSMLANHFRVDIGQLDLYKSINELADCQVIDIGLRSEFHAIRKAGNAVVHSRQSDAAIVQDAATSGRNDTAGAGDLQSAVNARVMLIGIFERVYLLINKGADLPSISSVEVGDFTSQQMLWKAVTTMDFEAKMAAGVILEAQALAPISRSALIIGRAEEAHKTTTVRMAAQLYWAACVISARVDRFSLTEINLKGGEDALLFKYADTEALYRYAGLTYDGDESEKSSSLGLKALEVAATRRYAPACSLYGNYLRSKAEYVAAMDFLKTGVSNGDLNALTGLAFLHLEKDSPFYSKNLAEKFLQEGISRGGVHCEFVLGRYLYEGEELDKDAERGRKLIESAAKNGHAMATHYLNMCVDNKLANAIQAGLLNLLMSVAPKKEITRQGRNEICQCGSGRKFKKCCELR